MAKIDTKNNKSGQSSENLSFEYPASERITIDKINLQVQLSKFKNAVLDSFNLESLVNFLITLVAVWLPMFTSDFKSLFGYSSSSIKGAYFGFVALATLHCFYKFIIKPIYSHFSIAGLANQDPEKMAQIILDKCNKK
jgi:hypothetical protein